MNMRNLAIWGLIGLLLLGLLAVMNGDPQQAGAQEWKISEVRTAAEEQRIREVTVTPDRVFGQTQKNSRTKSTSQTGSQSRASRSRKMLKPALVLWALLAVCYRSSSWLVCSST